MLRGLQVVALAQKPLDIRVLNLSLSSGSPLPYQFDPLTLALDALWRTASSSWCRPATPVPGPGTISSPGNDPTLLTVGALDECGTGSARTTSSRLVLLARTGRAGCREA